VAGLIATARFTIDPPRPVISRGSTQSAQLPDRGAEGFASLFARAYLSFDARDPEAHRLALAPFTGSSVEAEAGFRPPPSGEERVSWTEVVQARSPAPSQHLYTVAVQTDTAGLLYLSVRVLREADGRLALIGYPAFVGPLASAGAASVGRLREVDDAGLQTILTRALSNYLARAGSELAADLTPAAHVSLPGFSLALQSLDSLDWLPDGRSVLAVVRAVDKRGAQYRLAYELDVVSVAGRWEIAAIQIEPDR
jgi:Conjugative transposon protein TcpC